MTRSLSFTNAQPRWQRTVSIVGDGTPWPPLFFNGISISGKGMATERHPYENWSVYFPEGLW